MVGFYGFYVVVVVMWHWWLGRRRRRRDREALSRNHYVTPGNEDLEVDEEDEEDEDAGASAGERRSLLRHGTTEDFGALERGGHASRLAARDEEEEEEDREDAQERWMAGINSSMRVTGRPRHERRNTLNPIRPSLVGALEFRAVLSSLQKSRASQTLPIPLRRYSDDPNNTPVQRLPSVSDMAVESESSSSTPGVGHLGGPRGDSGLSGDDFGALGRRVRAVSTNDAIGLSLGPSGFRRTVPDIDVFSPTPPGTDRLQPSEFQHTAASNANLTVTAGRSPSPSISISPPPSKQGSRRPSQSQKEKSISEKFLGLVVAPSVFLLTVTLPVVENEKEDGNERLVATDGRERPSSRIGTAITMPPDFEYPSRVMGALSRRPSMPGAHRSCGLGSPAVEGFSGQEYTAEVAHSIESSDPYFQPKPSQAPVPDCDTSIPTTPARASNEWNRWLVAVQILTGPLFVVLVVWANTTEDPTNLRTLLSPILYALLAGFIVLALLILVTTADRTPRWHFMLCFVGFAVSIAWISTIANEVVGVLKAFGVILGISDAILGLTVFAVGNSLGDLVADVTVARLGLPVMALSACFGGPMLNILLGIGISGLYIMIRNGKDRHEKHPNKNIRYKPYEIEVSSTLMISAATLLVTLIGLLIVVPWNKHAFPTSTQLPFSGLTSPRNISAELFADLEELARLVDISYCVGTTGIQKPFVCASRCVEFKGFELVKTWNTGPLLSDSCGYIAVSHPPFAPRIVVAFRGTYSIANAIVDLSTIPQEYIPYPPDDSETNYHPDNPPDRRCPNCTVHAGFLASWKNTRPHLEPEIQHLVKQYPNHRLVLVGHSLGGAVASLASLAFYHRGWNPQVTTFGEPRVGNQALMNYFDARFYNSTHREEGSYRRVTHINDPVPLLPLKEWGYRMHAGEIYISKPDLLPSVWDLERCDGDEDPNCIAFGDSTITASAAAQWWGADSAPWPVPRRFRMWELFFAHRDYFWRLGLCLPGGDPKNWFRHYPPQHEDGDGRYQEYIN
ncbi:hypothetical protein FGG08_006841 [Glutinoglossum americanum]|uniref:Fungal lipase-like domain-containing protein n=1 Tax=Glutinoglossum americanum TaxID=1670608 RepID=A0A9P8I0N6_9PEZI|nr:hypothetical protein FGG08_006841 [Glutinoglossum americanum]